MKRMSYLIICFFICTQAMAGLKHEKFELGSLKDSHRRNIEYKIIASGLNTFQVDLLQYELKQRPGSQYSGDRIWMLTKEVRLFNKASIIFDHYNTDPQANRISEFSLFELKDSSGSASFYKVNNNNLEGEIHSKKLRTLTAQSKGSIYVTSTQYAPSIIYSYFKSMAPGFSRPVEHKGYCVQARGGGGCLQSYTELTLQGNHVAAMKECGTKRTFKLNAQSTGEITQKGMTTFRIPGFQIGNCFELLDKNNKIVFFGYL